VANSLLTDVLAGPRPSMFGEGKRL